MSGFDFFGARRAVFGCALPANTKMILIVLIEHMPDCYPSVPRIAQESGVSPRQVKREVQELERLGVIVVRRRIGQQSTYNLTEGWASLLPVPPSHRCQLGTSATQSPVPPSPATSATVAPPPVPPSHPKQKVKLEEKQEEFAPPPATREPCASFALEPSEAEPEKPKKPEHPEHAKVKAHYESEFQRVRGYVATWGPAQGKATNDLIRKLKGDLPECCRRITNGLEGWPKATILSIAGDPDKCVVAPSPGYTPRKTVERQHGDNPDLKFDSGKWSANPSAPVIPLASGGTR